ncbi:unnamed protein product [Enterobius vermicularis]|uniref:Bestrophin homolog n=1 Tax=Enterobius vermicularis TaxID=51028 RepID=A0A0N4VLE5_ENTVE|nr:unnamed protein product [Enterobius vermicularis]
MTIPYKHRVSTTSCTSFFRLIFLWRGSVWKAVLRGLIVWFLVFQAIAIFYTFGLGPSKQRLFRKIALGMNSKMSYIPLEFILGFFVSCVVKRWSDIVCSMGYLDDAAIYVGNVISGNDEQMTMIRRTIVRYLCLTQVLVYRDICECIRKRFPTYDSLIKAGFLLPEEKRKLESYPQLNEYYCSDDEGKYWAPIHWAITYTIRARQEGKIATDMWCTRITDEIRKFQNNMQTLCNYDWVQIPLPYPQFVFLAVNVYFGLCLFTRQFTEIDSRKLPYDSLQVPFPVITILQYTFYVGWMKVAGGLMNPFAEREDELESNFLIDKNFATTLFIVDNARDDLPEIKKDLYWECNLHYSQLNPLPDTDRPLIGSAAYRLPFTYQKLFTCCIIYKLRNSFALYQ